MDIIALGLLIHIIIDAIGQLTVIITLRVVQIVQLDLSVGLVD